MASTMPKTNPMIIDRMVRTIVTPTPLRIGGEKIHSPISGQSQLGFVTTPCTNIAANSAITPAPIHRPGWRTGTASIASGRPLWAVPSHPQFSSILRRGSAVPATVRPSLGTRVDLRGLDRAVADTPLVQDLLVGAVIDQRLDGTLIVFANAVSLLGITTP